MKEPNVFMETEDYGYHSFDWVDLKSLKLPLGRLSEKELKAFIKELKKYKDGLGECLPKIHLHYITNTQIYPIDGRWEKSNTYKLKITLFPKVLNSKCGAKRLTDCLNNIYNGKCKCEDVNRLLFERFFVENQIRGNVK